MALPTVLLYADLIDHLRYNYQGSDSDADLRDMRQAIQTAYREVAFGANWFYYYTRGRVQLNAVYQTGTVGVVASTGVATLSGGTWPSWAASGILRVNNVSYPVLTRTSDSALVVDTTYGPASDIVNSSFQIYQTTYSLPANFRGMNIPWGEASKPQITYASPNMLLGRDRMDNTAGDATFWTVTEDPVNWGGFCLQVFPYPNAAATLDFIYQRAPRDLRLTGYETNPATSGGTVSTSGTTVTGSGSSFTAAMVGSFLRVGSSTTNYPTGYGGAYPYTEQRKITAYSSSTSITIASAFSGTVSGLKYVISDPVDMWAGMMTALLRRMEHELAISRGKDIDRTGALAANALTRARENDSTLNFSDKQAGEGENSLASRNYVIAP